jgi:hypothetical protein
LGLAPRLPARRARGWEKRRRKMSEKEKKLIQPWFCPVCGITGDIEAAVGISMVRIVEEVERHHAHASDGCDNKVLYIMTPQAAVPRTWKPGDYEEMEKVSEN